MILKIVFTLISIAVFITVLLGIWLPRELEINSFRYFNPFREKCFKTKICNEDIDSEYSWKVYFTNDNWTSETPLINARLGYTYSFSGTKDKALELCSSLTSYKQCLEINEKARRDAPSTKEKSVKEIKEPKKVKSEIYCK